jgi:hypothetical protein
MAAYLQRCKGGGEGGEFRFTTQKFGRNCITLREMGVARQSYSIIIFTQAALARQARESILFSEGARTENPG